MPPVAHQYTLNTPSQFKIKTYCLIYMPINAILQAAYLHVAFLLAA